jgi:RNA polymerase sigma factor (sigma-70 family)
VLIVVNFGRIASRSGKQGQSDMTDLPSLESLFVQFRQQGDARALATVFDRTGPELGRVASYLSGGDHARAEDLLQQTWLTAMVSAAKWDARRPLLPWLLGVLANHARSAIRAQRRHVPGGDALAALLASDDPLRATADGEFAQLLARGLETLPSPFREAVALHVHHGLTAVEIGKALGRPAGTVRTQIVRGLDRLRALLPIGLATAGVGAVELPAQQMARARDHALKRLTPSAAGRPPAHAAKWAALVAVVSAVALLLVTGWSDQPVAPSAPSADSPSKVVAAEAATPPQREAMALPPAPDAVPSVVPQEPRARRITVHIRHEDEPKIEAGELVGLVIADEVRFLATDAQGGVVFDDLPIEEIFTAFVSGTGIRQDWVVPAQHPARFDGRPFHHELTLTVPAAGTLTVAVVDAVGRPVVGAEVDGNGSQHSHRRWCPLGFTGADGLLRRRGMGPRGAQLRARAAGHAVAPWQQAKVHDDGDMSCRLQVASAGEPLRGRVVDGNGAPVAADLGTIAFASNLVEPWYDRTDNDGTFAFDWLPNGHVAIVARTFVGTRSLIAIARFDVPSRGPVELRVGEGASLDVTTCFADGSPGGGSQVSLRLLADGAFHFPFAEHTRRSSGHGVLEFADLVPGNWLVKAQIGDALVEQLLELRAGTNTTWHAVAPPVQSLRVALRDERGQPLAGWMVQPGVERGWAGHVKVTDEDGVAGSRPPWRVSTDRPLTLTVQDPKSISPYFPCWRVPGILADGSVIDVVVPDRARSAHLVRGLVVDEHGQPLRASVMVVNRQVWWDGPRARTDADGLFAVGPFPPGRVRVIVSAPDRATLELIDVEVPVQGDAELGTLRIGRLAKVLALAADGGRVPADLDVGLTAVRGGVTFPLARRIDGAFEHDGLPPGEYRLLGSSGTHLVLPQMIVIAESAAPAVVSFQLLAAPTLRVVVGLGVKQRAASGFSASLAVRDHAGVVVLRRDIGGHFHGRVTSDLTATFALPTGAYMVELDDAWKPLRAMATVGDDGGDVRFVLDS